MFLDHFDAAFFCRYWAAIFVAMSYCAATVGASSGSFRKIMFAGGLLALSGVAYYFSDK